MYPTTSKSKIAVNRKLINNQFELSKSLSSTIFMETAFGIVNMSKYENKKLIQNQTKIRLKVKKQNYNKISFHVTSTILPTS